MIQKHALNVLCEGCPKSYNKDGDGTKVSIIFQEPTKSTQSTSIMFRGRHRVKLQ